VTCSVQQFLANFGQLVLEIFLDFFDFYFGKEVFGDVTQKKLIFRKKVGIT